MTTTKFTTKTLQLVSMVGLLLPLSAHADLILGTLNTTGTAQISLGRIGLGGAMTINLPASSQQGGFVALAGTMATIGDIVNPPDAVGPLNVPNYIVFQAAPNISFTLTDLFAGIDGSAGCGVTPAAAGQVCTPNIPNQSPFNLQNTSATSSTASFEIMATEVDSITHQTTLVTGIFTTQFASQNFQQILSTILRGGTVETTYSAQFITATPRTSTPEPGTIVELAAGLFLMGIGLVRSGRSHSNRKTAILNRQAGAGLAARM